MIAHQETDVFASAPKLHRADDDAGAVGTAIDQVTQQNDMLFGRLSAGMVEPDLFQQVVEQIEPAMHVADRIDAHAIRNCRSAFARVLDLGRGGRAQQFA